MMNMDDDKVIGEKDAARLLGISVQTLRRYRKAGDSPPWRRVGVMKIIYLESEVLAWRDRDMVR